MRDIKCRAWSNKWGKMILPEDQEYSIDVHAKSVWKGGIVDDAPILLQFTGLHDRNGKEIYEGDVVECYDHPTGVESGTFEIYFEHGHYKCRGSNIPLHDFGTVWTEIIGNIYENPNLIP